MVIDESASEWFWRIAKECYNIAKDHTLLIRENKEILIEKWTDFYFKKYKFENKTQLKEFLGKKLDCYCEDLEDTTFNDDPDAEDFIIDFNKDKRLEKFERDFHELIYDLEDHDPRILILENEKKKQSKTKEVKNKFVARLIGLLKRKK